MELTNFLIYQIAWYVFGTASAFAAALLFWQKGQSVVSGNDPTSGFGIRLSGAAGIFVAVLLVIHFINPMKAVIDPNKLLLVHSTAVEAEPGDDGGVRYTLESSQSIDAKLLGDHVAAKLIATKHMHDLKMSASQNAFTTEEPIPPGTYELHLADTETGELATYFVEIPAT